MTYNKVRGVLIGFYLYTRLIGAMNFEPPILLSNGDREWTVSELTPVGTQIGKFNANEKKNNLVFEMYTENNEFQDYLSVEPNTGIVRLKKSLLNVTTDKINFIGYASTKKTSLSSKTYFTLVITRETTPDTPGHDNSYLSQSTTDGNIISSISPQIPPPKDSSHPEIILLNNLTDIQNHNVSYEVVTREVKESKDMSSNIAWVPIAVPFIVLVVAIPAFGIFIWFLKYKHKKTQEPSKSSDFDDPVYHLSSLQFPSQRAFSNRYIFNATRFPHENLEMTRVGINNSKWEFPRQDLKVIGCIGEGCFGQVWEAQALNLIIPGEKVIVAIKTLKESANEKEKEDLLNELEVMKSLDPHPNVIRLLGCCTEEDPVYVIMEHMPYGKLQTYLRDRRMGHEYGNHQITSNSLSALDLTSFAYQVAKGMQYLSSKGILHRDLAARNILVGNNKLCKVSDFGLARDVIDSHIYERKSEGRLPIRWMAPESLFDNIFTSKTDVWSFGILIWEIVTLGSTPYPGMSASEVIRKVKEGFRLEKPDHCKRELYNIMYYCWNSDPEQRPSFGELCNLLENIMQTDTDYIDLNQFPEHSYYNILSPSSAEEKL